MEQLWFMFGLCKWVYVGYSGGWYSMAAAVQEHGEGEIRYG